MKKIIIGNWKLNLDHLEAIQLFQKLNYSLNNDVDKKIDIVVVVHMSGHSANLEEIYKLKKNMILKLLRMPVML